MPDFKLTDEQEAVLDHMENNDCISLISAGAGCSKTYISERVVKLLNPSKALYTAFNKAIVTEGIARFKGTNVECKTLHALAFKYVKPQGDIQDISYTCIAEDIGYKDKRAIIDAINLFYVSSSTDAVSFMEDLFMVEVNKDNKKFSDLALFYIDKMLDGEISPSFNFMLKYFHLLLVDGEVSCKYDLVILDEINDTTAVAIEIFKLIEAPKKLGLGESHQAIYQFLNLVDGFAVIEAPVLKLTHSFRCSTEIASNINNFMVKNVTKDFDFKGTDNPVDNGNTLYCTLTNSSIIAQIVHRLKKGKGFHLLRNLNEIFACPLAIITAGQGRKPYQPKYLFLQREYKKFEKMSKAKYSFYMYLQDYVEDKEVENAVNLLVSFARSNINLFDVFKQAKESPVDMKYTISTVYTAKGLEYTKVILSNEFERIHRKIHEKGGIRTEEYLTAYRCMYVACSRAGKELVNAEFLTAEYNDQADNTHTAL